MQVVREGNKQLLNEKSEHPNNSKRFDCTIIAIFGELDWEIIPCLLSEAHRPEGLADEELNVELNRNTISIDVGRHIVYKGDSAILNLEAQSGPDDDLLPRMLEYAINLYRKYKRQPVVSVGLFLFKCEIPKVPFVIECGGDRFIEFRPIIICMWETDPQTVVDRHQRCLYTLLPTMKEPKPDLLKQALQELYEQEDPQDFRRYLAWFETMLSRTTTMLEEDEQIVQEYVQMQYQLHPLLAENPTIQNVIAEGIARGLAEEAVKTAIKTLQESILDIATGRFSTSVVNYVRRTIAPSHNIDELRKLHRQLAQVSDEQEVYPLLEQFSAVLDEELKEEAMKGEIKGAQELILDFLETRFSMSVYMQVRQAITPIQDVAQLKDFFRQLVRLSDKEDVLALLKRCFPTQ